MFQKVGDSLQKMYQSKDFQKGVELFRKKHNLPPVYPNVRMELDEFGVSLGEPEAVRHKWYSKRVSGEEWRKKYINNGYTILEEEKKKLGKVEKLEWVRFAFQAVVPPLDCLEVTNKEELNVIKKPWLD